MVSPNPVRVPRLARPVVALLALAMVASALFSWEPWPLSSFRLFSQLRSDEQSAWSATTVEASGEELPYALGGETDGFRGFPFLASEFAEASEQRRDELCVTWVDAAPRLVGRDAIEVRLYLRRWTLSDRRDDRALPGTTTLEYVCDAEGATDVR